ncbi:MAG TPA: cytochrome c oxidase subunit 3 [Candidatus Udaeobacter sp.]|jgi:heme/copper-type cytochrome/quinol oxidase subunit 3|nr:cytochrome c oxidase subunit 3 [Candidatus Udaeobacter sp.]
MNTAVIDVSRLPPAVEDHTSPIWWGNLLLLFIETTMFALLVGSYFYLRMNFTNWPPVRSDVSLYQTDPDLGFATANLLVLIASCVPMFIVDRACLRLDLRSVRFGMAAMVLIGLVTIALRFFEFSGLKFRWDDNAYSAIVWTILGMHLLHLITGTAENLLMTLWVWFKGLDIRHARDVRVGAVYWYWIALVWIPLYALVYLGPRCL